MQRCQIVQFGQHALEAAAKKVIVQNLAVCIGLIDRQIVPVIMHLAMCTVALLGRHLGTTETIGENIIGDTASKPICNRIRTVKDRQLVQILHGIALIADTGRAAADIFSHPMTVFDCKIIPI